ncbi:MAG: hypothetical protein Kow0032_05640 [Methyloligellaceae bacterium]
MRRYPDSAVLLNMQAIAQAMQGREDEALATFERAQASDPACFDAWFNHANILKARGRYDRAFESYRRAAAILPGSDLPLINMGLMCFEAGRFDEAAALFSRAAQINPNNPDSHNNLGTILVRLHEHDEAVLSFARALLLNPDYPGALKRLANSLRECRSLPDNDTIAGLIIRCLESREIDSTNVDNVSKLIIHARLQDVLAKEDLALEDVSALDGMTRGLLSPYMSNAVVSAHVIEQFLCRARAVLLDAREAPAMRDPDEKLETLLAAFAHQGFLNEYIWYVPAAEEAKVDALEADVRRVLAGGGAPAAPDIFLLAAYRPLFAIAPLRAWGLGAWERAPEPLKSVLRKQIVNPAEEMRLREAIPSLTAIGEGVSQCVQAQYEENPYPRWEFLSVEQPQDCTWWVMQDVSPHQPVLAPPPENPQILVAGCGTGKHPITSALCNRKCDVLAVDLSRASLAYAKRMAHEFGVENVTFAHADILKLGDLGRSFDIIESSGVLHHMEDPDAGLKALIRLLKPGGYMKLGLYSEAARADVVAIREMVAGEAVDLTARGLGAFRRDLFLRKPDIHARLGKLRDFYSTSELRDLLFHVQEHRYTMSGLANLIFGNGLEFLGFLFSMEEPKLRYQEMFPEDPDCLNLENWQKLEEAEPLTFVGMYQFWCRKPY